ncbi:putative patatin/cPLA2 family phospholipase [Peptoniphilus koenoeneniae]|uniref:Patatin/cPLA2 family phospholipase n=1 Tax=Peptoniphilus koenoeneniae TaxID=507751 RepID=A0ABU0AX84_9FIRM|nr:MULTISPECIES: patatin family protein [Peptoniphilus]ERT57966.1 phospholipase, patatin family [Peptoniphilus sp. BV3C26]MDQ0275392.1 putative patatin/cPLA2 family phospholipase [Peptoniphilus koenoeneniae]
MKSNVFDTALIFEGGGMRNSYSAGILNVLLEKGIYFDYVSGISAGSTHVFNYLLRDRIRAKRSFVDSVRDENVAGIKNLLKGQGFFNSDYIFESWDPYPDSIISLETFYANPAKIRIGAFNANTGRMKYWNKRQLNSMEKLRKAIRASSSLPYIMQPTEFEGQVYYDGGLGYGISLDMALRDGYQKIFAVLTRPEGYRKEPIKHKELIKKSFKSYPHVANAMITRYKRYNRDLDRLEKLKEEGKAYIVYAKNQAVESTETNLFKLQDNYEQGYFQGLNEYRDWLAFLGI